MASFLDKFTKRGQGDGGASAAISQLSDNRAQIRVEIEGTPHFYFAKPTLRSGQVVIFTPERFQKSVTTGGWVRLRMPTLDNRELRLQITGAKHGGTATMATTPDYISLLCKLPGATVVDRKRISDRYSTVQFRDLFLDVTSPSVSTYQVLDISGQGLKIQVPDDQHSKFPLGNYLNRGRIRLGTKATIDLLDIVPRCHLPNAIGLEIVVNPKGNSRKILDMFLDSMEQKAIKSATPTAEKKPAETQESQAAE